MALKGYFCKCNYVEPAPLAESDWLILPPAKEYDPVDAY
jgi:hypothetical protein